MDKRLSPRASDAAPRADGSVAELAPRKGGRPRRPDPADTARLNILAEIERAMGVKPILGRTRPRPGY